MAASDTYDIVTAVLGYLETNLPAELTAQSLPSMNDYTYGFFWGPKSHLPLLGVDASQWRLRLDELAGNEEATVTVLVLAGIDGADAETASQRVHKLGDAIRKVLTASVTIAGTNMALQVLTCDYSPAVQRASALCRFVLVTSDVFYEWPEGT